MLDGGAVCWLTAAAAAAAAALAWLWLLRPLGHWQRLGVPFEPGRPFFGNYFRVLTQRSSAGEVLAEIYRKHENKAYVGVFQFSEPAIMVRDPELVRTILVKDFAYFRDNVFPVNKDLDPLLAKNPFALSGDEWKASRQKLTSTFSSSRIRNMLPLIAEVCDEMLKYVRNDGPSSLPGGMDVKELASRFTTESVSSVAFSLRANCFEDANAEVRLMNRQIMEPTGLRMMQLTLQIFMPSLARIMRVRMMPLEVDRYFRRLVRDAVDHRARAGVERVDFLQMLLQIRKKSEEAGDSAYGEEEMTSHALSFFVDGFETSSVALSLLLHDLAHSPADQERLRAELRALDAADHEAVLHAPFLNACLQETLRLHPPGTFLRKQCTAAWRLPAAEGAEGAGEGEGPVLTPGTQMLVPLLALHTDPSLVPHALRWWPQRWLPDESGAPPPSRFVVLPFGEGPRQCLGMRFALAQVKMGAAALVRNFALRLTPRSPPNPPPLDPASFLYAAKGGLWLNFVPLGDSGPAAATAAAAAAAAADAP